MSDIAIAHKDYAVRGGGEFLAEELAKIYDSPLYIGGKHSDSELKYDDIRLIDRTPIQRWAIKRGGILRALAYNVAWQNEDRLTAYDTIITSGNEPLWYVPESHQALIAYCHSPPREMYDLNHGTGDGALGAFLRSAKRAWFQHNTTRPDLWVANGEEVARRVELYFGVPKESIRVVYPPVQTEVLHPGNAPTGNYYLYLGRLAHHKRVELAIEACNALGRPLKIAGRGPQKPTLESLAGPTVDVLGYVPEKQKRRLLARARALLMPAENEDFGIVPIEAMASGTPVIGVDEGMTGSQIVDGKNGLIAAPTVDSFRETIERFEAEGVEWSDEEIRSWTTARFGVDHFRQGMRQVVEEVQSRTQTDLSIQPVTTADD